MAQLTPSTNTLMYTCPASKTATKNIRFCNIGASAYTIRAFRGAGGSPAAGDEIVYGETIAANAVVEVTQQFLVAGEKLWAWVSNASVSVNVYGPEEDV